jgi:hypothetical protein
MCDAVLKDEPRKKMGYNASERRSAISGKEGFRMPGMDVYNASEGRDTGI